MTYRIDMRAFAPPYSSTAKYWLGFLMADGCVTYRGGASQRQYAVKLGLIVDDAAHLARLAAFVGDTSRPIHRYNNAAMLTICSKAMCEQLMTLGITPRKSGHELAGQFAFDRDFWRGAIDGDGSVEISKRAALPRLRFTSASKQFTDELAAFCRYVVPWAKARVCARPPKNSRVLICGKMCNASATLYTLEYSGNPAREIIRALYTDCEIALDRKYETAKRILADTRYAHVRYPLSTAAVQDILQSECSSAALGRKYGVTTTTVCRIRNGGSWKEEYARCHPVQVPAQALVAV